MWDKRLKEKNTSYNKNDLLYLQQYAIAQYYKQKTQQDYKTKIMNEIIHGVTVKQDLLA